MNTVNKHVSHHLNIYKSELTVYLGLLFFLNFGRLWVRFANLRLMFGYSRKFSKLFITFSVQRR